MSSRSISPLLGAAALSSALVVLSVTVAIGFSLKPPPLGLGDSAGQRVIPERSLTFVEMRGATSMVTGFTASANFPVTPNARDERIHPGVVAVVERR